MSVARPNDANSAKVTVTLESSDGGTRPSQDSDMNVQATVIAALMTVTHGQTSTNASWIFVPLRKISSVLIPSGVPARPRSHRLKTQPQ